METNSWLRGVLAVTSLFLTLSAQAATTVVGDWIGQVIYPPGAIDNTYGLSLETIFQSQTPIAGGDALSGMLEVVCTSPTAPADCGTGGFRSFIGTVLDSGSLELRQGGRSFVGSFSSDFRTFSVDGHDSVGIPVTLTAALVPEPGTARLLYLGSAALLVLLRGKRKTPKFGQ